MDYFETLVFAGWFCCLVVLFVVYFAANCLSVGEIVVKFQMGDKSLLSEIFIIFFINVFVIATGVYFYTHSIPVLNIFDLIKYLKH